MKSLSPERWRQIDAIFAAALERSPEEREGFVRAQCGEDVELRQEVEVLLGSIDEAEAAFGESVSQYAHPLVDDLRQALEREEMENLPGGGRIGPYRLLRVIGRGGMGAVYLAERADDQFEKQVALKLVKRGMDTDEVLQRFRYERQILAALEHPNIGRLYDGGAAEDGRPYLVMEHIDGEAVTTYCDVRRLSIDDRLRIFETICGAVQFAHRNLVIHRDLKPSNILVTADGTVKLLDFGIAKLLDPANPDLAPRTRTEMRLLTPEYASPEQVEGAPVTTATDVYSLGVILFELLTGRRPSQERGRRTHDRFGLDTGLGRPSSTVVHPLPSGDETPARTAEEIAARRGTTPERLRMRLRGDLDTITLKALAEEPDRRYHSAEQLLADVQRFRRGLPVAARGESLGYRTRKFVRRHRVVVSLSGALTLLLLGFVSTTFIQNARLREARVAEELRQGQAEDLIGFMLGDLQAKLTSIGRTDVLDDAAQKAAEYFMAVPPDQLSDEELFRRTEQMRLLGRVRFERGDVEGAGATFRDAYGLSEGLLRRDPANAAWRLGLATDLSWLGSVSHQNREFEEALGHFNRQREHARALVDASPEELRYRLELSEAHGNIGTVLEAMGDHEGALREYLLALEQKRTLAEQEPENEVFQSALATAYNKVAVAEQQRGSLSTALEHHRAELQVRQALVARRSTDMPARRLLSLAHSYLGELLMATGDADGALEQRLAAWHIQEDLVRWDSANVGWQRGLAMSARLAGLGLGGAGRQAEGLAALNDSREILLRLLARDPASADYRVQLARTESSLASVLLGSRPQEAEAAARRSLEVVASIDATTPRLATAKRTESGSAYLELGRSLAALGRAAEAREAWARSVALLEDAPETLSHLATRASALLHLGRVEEARPITLALLQRGYRQPEFVALARRNGLIPSPGR